MGARQKDGRTLRWHLETVLAQTGIVPPQLDLPPIPYELVHVWDYFLQMNVKRTSGGVGANPISDEQIMAWERRHGVRLSPFEGECIDELDQVFMAGASEA